LECVEFSPLWNASGGIEIKSYCVNVVSIAPSELEREAGQVFDSR